MANVKGHDNTFILFASEFFNHKLSVYEINKGDGKLLRSRVIDNTIDQAYSVKYLDIDGDGKHELLVNNHETDNSKAAIFLYDIPADGDLFTVIEAVAVCVGVVGVAALRQLIPVV